MREELIARIEQLKRLTTTASFGEPAELIACIESLSAMADNKDYHEFFRIELGKTGSFARDLENTLKNLALHKPYCESIILLFSFLEKLKTAKLISDVRIAASLTPHLVDYSIEQLAEGKADLFLEIIAADTLLGKNFQPLLFSLSLDPRKNLEKVFNALVKRGEVDDYLTILKVLTQTSLISYNNHARTSILFGFLLLQEIAELRVAICDLLIKALPHLSATDSLKLLNFLIQRCIKIDADGKSTEIIGFHSTLFYSFSKAEVIRKFLPLNPDLEAIKKYINLLKNLAETDPDLIAIIQDALQSTEEKKGIVSYIVAYTPDNYEALFALISNNLLNEASLSEARSHLIKFFNSRSDAQLLEILARKEACILSFLKANRVSLPWLANTSDPKLLLLMIEMDLLSKEETWLGKSALAKANDRFIAALGYDEKNPSREQIDSLMNLLRANKNNPGEIARIKPMIQGALLIYVTRSIKEKRELAAVRTLIAAILDPENDSYGKTLFPFSSTAKEEKHFADFLPLLKSLNGELAETLDRARSGRAVAKFFTERTAASAGAGRHDYGDEHAIIVEEFNEGIAKTVSIGRPAIQ